MDIVVNRWMAAVVETGIQCPERGRLPGALPIQYWLFSAPCKMKSPENVTASFLGKFIHFSCVLCDVCHMPRYEWRWIQQSLQSCSCRFRPHTQHPSIHPSLDSLNRKNTLDLGVQAMTSWEADLKPPLSAPHPGGRGSPDPTKDDWLQEGA